MKNIKKLSTALVLLFSVLAQGDPLPASHTVGTRLNWSPCPSGSLDYIVRKLDQENAVFSPISRWNASLLDCAGDDNLYLLTGEISVASNNYDIRHPSNGYEVVRVIPRGSIEARFLFASGDEVIARGVQARDSMSYDRTPRTDESVPAPRETALNNEYFHFYLEENSPSRCEDGTAELKYAKIQSQRGYGSRENIFQSYEGVSLGLCLSGVRDPFSYDHSLRLRVLDYRWESDDVITLLYEGIGGTTGHRYESLQAIQVNVATSTATRLYEIAGTINGIQIFSHGCGEYMLGARLIGTSVVIFYKRPRVVSVDVSNPSSIRASLEYFGASTAATCEGASTSFSFGRRSLDYGHYVEVRRSFADYLEVTWHTPRNPDSGIQFLVRTSHP